MIGGDTFWGKVLESIFEELRPIVKEFEKSEEERRMNNLNILKERYVEAIKDKVAKEYGVLEECVEVKFMDKSTTPIVTIRVPETYLEKLHIKLVVEDVNNEE